MKIEFEIEFFFPFRIIEFIFWQLQSHLKFLEIKSLKLLKITSIKQTLVDGSV